MLISFQSISQKRNLNDTLPYWSHGGELILSFYNLKSPSVNVSPRLTGAIHWQSLLNVNLNRFLGIYTGIALRNIGCIYKLHDSTSNNTLKYKQRSYTLGIPLAIKIGNMNKKKFIYAGGEIEYAFAYKQKIYEGKHKDIYSEWFGKQVNPLQPSVFAGVQFRGGLNFKFKYYLRDFFNKNYTTIENGNAIKPFSNLNAKIFYFSLSIMISKKKKKATIKKNIEQPGLFTKSIFKFI